MQRHRVSRCRPRTPESSCPHAHLTRPFRPVKAFLGQGLVLPESSDPWPCSPPLRLGVGKLRVRTRCSQVPEIPSRPAGSRQAQALCLGSRIRTIPEYRPNRDQPDPIDTTGGREIAAAHSLESPCRAKAELPSRLPKGDTSTQAGVVEDLGVAGKRRSHSPSSAVGSVWMWSSIGCGSTTWTRCTGLPTR